MAQGKLQSLLKTNTLAEQQAMQKVSQVLTILEQRKNIVEELRRQKTKLMAKQEMLMKEGRLSAIQDGDSISLSTITSYGKRLQKQIEQIELKLQPKEEELGKAQEHAKWIEEDLIQARLERKKIEKLIENNQRSANIREAAKEDLYFDDFVRPSNKK